MNRASVAMRIALFVLVLGGGGTLYLFQEEREFVLHSQAAQGTVRQVLRAGKAHQLVVELDPGAPSGAPRTVSVRDAGFSVPRVGERLRLRLDLETGEAKRASPRHLYQSSFLLGAGSAFLCLVALFALLRGARSGARP